MLVAIAIYKPIDGKQQLKIRREQRSIIVDGTLTGDASFRETRLAAKSFDLRQ